MKWHGLVGWMGLVFVFAGCDGGGEEPPPEVCLLDSGETPELMQRLGCDDDFEALASAPLDASIPGARSLKTVIDRMDGNQLFFQNSKLYPIHWDFCRAHRSGHGLPPVGELTQFNEVEYYSPDRRFILGALTYYEGPKLWIYEIAPYDTASAEMVVQAYERIAAALDFEPRLHFHPTSASVELIVPDLPGHIRIATTDDIFAGIDYQPLNLAVAMGRLRFLRSGDLENNYVNFRDIVVLDKVPNDISAVSGIITAEFQTPLSHINVLSQNRGTPNMGLRGALESKALRALEGKWVRLEVGAFDWSIAEVSREEADTWWEAHRPPQVAVPHMDLGWTELTDMPDMLDPELTQKEALRKVIPAFGGKAGHYAVLASIAEVPVPRAFAIPIFYYDRFMRDNGFYDRVRQLLADPGFRDDPAVRDIRLLELRQDIKRAPFPADLSQALREKLARDFPSTIMRFRSSTNGEDLPGFTGAGLYTSKTGDPNDPQRSPEDAILAVWASVWRFRAFEERSYRSIEPMSVGMAILVNHAFPAEEANGVALTANIFDPSGLEPAFYINVQKGEASVVLPEPGVTTDQLLYLYGNPGRPIVYLAHSNQVRPGGSVLTDTQVHELGTALQKIHQAFWPIYGPPPDQPGAWYAMDVEFKFDDELPGQPVKLAVKQARPHPGRGGTQ